MAANRDKYQFMGSWPWEVIYGEYPIWKEGVDGAAEAAKNGWTQITVSKDMLNNAKGKEYSNARWGTIKLNPMQHTVAIPEGKQVVRVVVHGYSNAAEPATLTDINGQTVNYVFPAKGYNPVYAAHTIDLTNPADQLKLTFTGPQCCVTIRIYCK